MRLSAKRTSPGETPKCSAATPVIRSLIRLAASSAAMPLRSEPDDAAVAEVLGTLSVEAGEILIRSRSIWNASETTWAILT